jgi:hypothetical protein
MTFAANLSPSFCIGAGMCSPSGLKFLTIPSVSLIKSNYIAHHAVPYPRLTSTSPQRRLRRHNLSPRSKGIPRPQKSARHNQRSLGIPQPHNLRPSYPHRRRGQARPIHHRPARLPLPGQSPIPSTMDHNRRRQAKVGKGRCRVSHQQEHRCRKGHQLCHGMVSPAKFSSASRLFETPRKSGSSMGTPRSVDSAKSYRHSTASVLL